MSRYEIFEGPGDAEFLLDVQSNFLDHLTTRVVIPLYPLESVPPAAKRLHPTFTINGARYLLATHLLTAVPSSLLGEPKGSLHGHHDEIVAALDMLFQGF